MPSCIYCPEEATSHEHWIPRGLGAFQGYTPLLGQIGPDCNERLGKLDQELALKGPTGLHRALLGIKGRHGGPKVAPFRYKTMGADPPTTMKMPAPGGRHEVFAEAYTDEEGRPSARPIRQVVLRMPDGRVECVPFPRGWGADQLRNAITNRGLEGGAPFEVYFDDDEEHGEDPQTPFMLGVRGLLTAVFGKFEARAYGGAGEQGESRLTMLLGIDLLYLRAVAKVAFHYFLWACPVLSGHDPAFKVDAPLGK